MRKYTASKKPVETLSLEPIQGSRINQRDFPSRIHALAMYEACGHITGCPALSPPPTGPCLCVLHMDPDTLVWYWM